MNTPPRPTLPRHALLASLIVLLAITATAQTDQPLQATVQALAAAHHGKVGLYAEDLATGKTVAVDADKPVPTASVIKLAILYEALQQVRAGAAHFDDKLTLARANQVPGAGVLTFLDTPLQLTLKDALTLMIIVSDNTATNLAIDDLGLKNIDDQLLAIGLKNTWLYKKVSMPPVGPMPADQKVFGLGKTTPREMASLLQRFLKCDLDPPGRAAPPANPQDQALCEAAMHMLKSQSDRDSIPRYLETQDSSENASAIANKTGALDAVRNDVGIVFTKHGPILISAFTYENQDHSWTADNEGQLLIARLAKAIVAAWAQITPVTIGADTSQITGSGRVPSP